MVGNYGPSVFSVEEVQKIAILDLRIINCDRNEENILVAKSSSLFRHSNSKSKTDYFLIPIDHGLSLPDSIGICCDEVVWFDWNQVKEPIKPDFLNFISQLNPLEDVNKLAKTFLIRDACLVFFRAAEILLMKGAAAGLTLHDIAKILFREDSEEKSKFEEIIKKSRDNYMNLKPLMKNFPDSANHFEVFVVPQLKSHIKQNGKNSKKASEEEKLNDILEELSLQKSRSYSQDHSLEDLKVENLLTPLLISQKDSCDSSKKEIKPTFSIPIGKKNSFPTLQKSNSMLELKLQNDLGPTPQKRTKKRLKPSKPNLSTDNCFFFFVENYIDQIVSILSKEKNKSQSRGRFYSTRVGD